MTKHHYRPQVPLTFDEEKLEAEIKLKEKQKHEKDMRCCLLRTIYSVACSFLHYC